MTQVMMDESKLKALFKTAIVEVLEERKDLLRDAIEETLEDIALARAIEEGRRTSAKPPRGLPLFSITKE